MEKVKFWVVYDMLTGGILDMYKTEKRAWNRVLELDELYPHHGKHRYNIRPI